MRDVEMMAKEHPRLLAGLWFGGAALLPAVAIGVYYLLLLAAEGPLVSNSGYPLDVVMALYLVILPPVLAFGAGALIGLKILLEPRHGQLAATGWGALVGLTWLAVWMGIGELIMLALDLGISPPANPALMAFGYGMVGVGCVLLVLWNAFTGWALGRLVRGG